MSEALKPIQVVIGANYGDEGKGQTVHDIARKFMDEGFSETEILGIKYNGGAQAGHTARGFVHHTLSSADTLTYLAKQFLFNPVALNKECKDYMIQRMMTPHTVYVNPRCRVTTPIDILMNQIVETVRNKGRHGSCGMGIHATIVRNSTLPLEAKDLISETFDRKMFTKLLKIHYNGFCQAIRNIPEEFCGINIDKVMDDFYDEADTCFGKYAKVMDFGPLMATGIKRIIYEGAQGLLLDEDNMASYPHVTPSHTGSDYVIDDLSEYWRSEWPDVTVNYVMRTFVTRHGAGPLDNETDIKDILGETEGDSTNVPNEWQGTIRYARYNNDICFPQVMADAQKWKEFGMKPEFRAVVTWQDICPDIVTACGSVLVEDFVKDFDGYVNK